MEICCISCLKVQAVGDPEVVGVNTDGNGKAGIVERFSFEELLLVSIPPAMRSENLDLHNRH